MTVNEALTSCEMYVHGHPITRRICRDVSVLMHRHFNQLPVPGTKGQVTFASPANFLCIDIVCARKPSVTISLRGAPVDYAVAHLSHLMVPARLGTVRIRTSTEYHRFAAIRAFGQAAFIATGNPLPLVPMQSQTQLPLKPETTPNGSVSEAPDPGSSPPANPTPGEPVPLPSKALPKPPGLDPGLIFGKPDPFLAPIDDLELDDADADPDVFNPAVDYLHNVTSAMPPTPPAESGGGLVELRLQMGRIAMLLGDKSVTSLKHSAHVIRLLRSKIGAGHQLRSKLLELVAIWRLVRQEIERKFPCAHLGLPTWDATELLAKGVVVPSRSPQLGGRRDPLPSPAAVAVWLERYLGSEDGVREFSCFSIREHEPVPSVQPLLRFGQVAVLGSRIAPLYREGRLSRPWDAERPADMAILHDYLLALAVVPGKGLWTLHQIRTAVPRIRPYVRSIADDDLFSAATNGIGFLEGCGLLAQKSLRAWRVRPEGLQVFDKHIGPAWLKASV